MWILCQWLQEMPLPFQQPSALCSPPGTHEPLAPLQGVVSGEAIGAGNHGFYGLKDATAMPCPGVSIPHHLPTLPPDHTFFWAPVLRCSLSCDGGDRKCPFMTEMSIQPTKGISKPSFLSVKREPLLANKSTHTPANVCSHMHVHATILPVRLLYQMEGGDTGNCSFIILQCG